MEKWVLLKSEEKNKISQKCQKVMPWNLDFKGFRANLINFTTDEVVTSYGVRVGCSEDDRAGSWGH